MTGKRRERANPSIVMPLGRPMKGKNNANAVPTLSGKRNQDLKDAATSQQQRRKVVKATRDRYAKPRVDENTTIIIDLKQGTKTIVLSPRPSPKTQRSNASRQPAVPRGVNSAARPYVRMGWIRSSYSMVMQYSLPSYPGAAQRTEYPFIHRKSTGFSVGSFSL